MCATIHAGAKKSVLCHDVGKHFNNLSDGIKSSILTMLKNILINIVEGNSRLYS
jgi:hypothetical protein